MCDISAFTVANLAEGLAYWPAGQKLIWVPSPDGLQEWVWPDGHESVYIGVVWGISHVSEWHFTHREFEALRY